ncbi:hypothetical protein HYW75_03445 [Candidatus Pacearchaeota archaeon]|nr:hypothetical protein [Candidatus Pacearchaeota archaeon]
MPTISDIKKEHAKIELLLKNIEQHMENNIPIPYLIFCLTKLNSIWNEHERKEEDIFNPNSDFPVEKMIIEQHRQLRGHWRIISGSISEGDVNKILVSLNTDGRMLIDKFRKHMNLEENYLKIHFIHSKI